MVELSSLYVASQVLQVVGRLVGCTVIATHAAVMLPVAGEVLLGPDRGGGELILASPANMPLIPALVSMSLAGLSAPSSAGEVEERVGRRQPRACNAAGLKDLGEAVSVLEAEEETERASALAAVQPIIQAVQLEAEDAAAIALSCRCELMQPDLPVHTHLNKACGDAGARVQY